MTTAKAKTKKEPNLNVAVVKSDFISLELSSYAKKLKKDIPLTQFGYSLEFKLGVDEDKESVEILVYVKIYKAGKNSNDDKKLAEFVSRYKYLIKDIKHFTAKVDNETTILKDEIARLLIGISVSSCRGMFSVSSKNTILKNAVIPIINQSKIERDIAE